MKKLKIAALILVLALAGLFIATSLYLDSTVKQAINTYGPQYLQVPIQVDDVSLSPLSGSGTLSGLVIGNPNGFESEYLMNIGLLSVDMDINSLLTNHIIVEDLLLRNMHVIYERKGGTSNVDVLQQAMEENQPAAAQQTVTINHLVMDESRVTLQASLLGAKSVNLRIPKTERENIGSENTSVAQIIKITLEPILGAVKNAGIKAIQKSTDVKVKDKVKGLFNKDN